MTNATATRTGGGLGLLLFIVAVILLAAVVVAHRPSKPPHTPRPGGPTNVRPAEPRPVRSR